MQNSIWFNLLLMGIAVALGLASYKTVRQAVELSRTTEFSRQKIEQLTLKKQQLEDRIAELQTPEAQERLAKERLNLKKAGEEVVVVPENSYKPEKDNNSGWLSKITSIFKNLFK